MLRRGNRYEPATLDPHKYMTKYEANIILDLFEGLFTYNIQGRPVAGIIDSWKVSPDAKAWTFQIKPYLKWSDGAPLTAEDVVFSFRRLMDPKTAGQYAQLLYIVENGRAVNTGAMPVDKLGVSAPDKTTVVVKLDVPAPYLNELLANPFAAILPRHAVEKNGPEWIKPGMMVSGGAYALKAWSPNDRIELARNPNFHGADAVKIDRVLYMPTENLAAGLARFRAGELDMQVEFPTAQLDMLRSELPEATRTGPSFVTYYLAFNTKTAKLGDVRVRRALALAVDREVITSRIMRAGEEPAYTFIPARIANFPGWTHVDATLTLQQRLQTAAGLLAQAGYTKDKPLKVTYSLSATEDLKRIGVAIQSMWKRVGVETELLNREGRVHFAAMKSGDYEVGFVGWAADFNDASTFLYMLQSSSINSNYSRYDNPNFEALLGKAALETNVVARGLILQQAEKTALADQPIAPLFHGVTRNLIAPHVAGWQPNPLDFYLTRYLGLKAH